MNFKTKLLNLLRELFKLGFIEKFLQSKTQQKTTSSFWVKLLPNNYQYPTGSIRFATQNGIHFKLDISDLVDWHVYFGIHEPAQTELFSLCHRGDCVIDVGTNIGKVLLNFSNRVGNTGTVIGFEPDEFNFKKCEQNISLNKPTNVKLFQMGLGDEVTQLHMFVKDANNRGMNRISSESAGENESENTIQITTLDTMVSKLLLQKINLIKIDVEGFELKVLKGAHASLNKFHPVLFIELDDVNLMQQGATAEQLIRFLKDLNYNIKRADTGELLNEQYNFSNCHFDIICK
jgi:FkbM family methyltransferase